jgi:hypothetical protein
MRRLALSLVLLLAAGCRDAPRPAAEPAAEPGPAHLVGEDEAWSVEVSVEPESVGPLELFVGPVRRSSPNVYRPRATHELVYANGGDRPVHLLDPRSGTFLGDMQLFVSDELCGVGGRPLSVDCVGDDRGETLRPHESLAFTMTLTSGLEGMNPLAPGRYVLVKELQYFVGGWGVGVRHNEEVRLVYGVALSVRATN